MKKSYQRGIKIIMGIIVLASAIYSCQKEVNDPFHKSGLRIFLTDDPSLVLDAVYIDIKKLEVKQDDDEGASGREMEPGDDSNNGQNHGNDDATDDHGGWIALNINAGVYNLMQLRNGLDTALAWGDLPQGFRLHKIRLTLGTNNSVVWNGNSFPLLLKDKDGEVIIKLSDDIAAPLANNTGSLWLDFDAGRSVRKNGTVFELKSSVKVFAKSKSGAIEGRVLPIEAKPVLYAIQGTDTSTARPGNEGEFKIMGLKEGTYNLWVTATNNTYRDTLLQNLHVRTGEDLHTGTITLRR